MDWAYLRGELQRIIVYVVLALAAKGGYSLLPGSGLPVNPPYQPPTVPIAPPATPPVVPPVNPPLPRVDPEAAVVRITSGSAGCTATIIGPSPKKGYQFALSAAHCVGGRGSPVRVFTKSERTYSGVVYSFDRKNDLCLIVIPTADELPYAKIAEACPPEGTPIWHRGNGVDRPGNRESGTMIRNGCDGTWCRMQISVSSGDSGCGFFRQDSGELVATCYGTDGRFAVGPGVVAIRSFLKAAAA